MNKKALHHLLVRTKSIHVRYLLVPLILSILVCMVALRANNLRMVQLREAVYVADKAGGDIETALQGLRSHVHSHMNTGLATGDSVYPPIQLKHTYQRLQQVEKDRVKKTNAQVYTAAQGYCEQQHPDSFSGSSRVPCIEQYVSEHNAQEREVPSAMYKFDFVSPNWSPDTAGYSMVASTILFITLVVRLVLVMILKRLTS